MENVRSEQRLGVTKQEFNNGGEDDSEENKENLVPDDIDDCNINSLAHQLIRSAKKSTASKLYNRLSVKGIEVELPQIKHHDTISGLDEIKNTPKNDLPTHSVVESEYIYEHINSGSNVFKCRKLFPNEFEPEINSNNTVESKEIIYENDCTQFQHNQSVSSNIHSAAIKIHIKKKRLKVPNLGSQDGVQVIKNKELGHSGIRVLEKQLHTIPKPCSFESCKSSAFETPQGIKSAEQQCMFKARPATVLKKKPFVPKHEKRCTEARNIYLSTERRAKDWMVFEQKMKVNFLRQEEISRKRQEEIRKKEMDLIKNMRQLTIHKPEPIKKYKPILIRKSLRPVTVPLSPRFSVRPARNYLNSICE